MMRALHEKVTTLTNVVTTNVYPEIANELLSKDGILVKSKVATISNIEENIVGDELLFDEAINRNEKLKSSNTVIQGLFNKI